MKLLLKLFFIYLYILTVESYYDPIKQTYKFDYYSSFQQLEEKISSLKVEIVKSISDIISKNNDLNHSLQNVPVLSSSNLDDLIINIHDKIISINPYMDNVFKAIVEQPYILAPILQICLILAFMIGNISNPTNMNSSSFQNKDLIYQSGEYNPNDAEIYYSKRQFLVINRFLTIAATSAKFGFGLLIDYLNKVLIDPKQESIRAEQLTTLLTNLGPTFIKIGQSLSVRTDLLRPAYIKALIQLQDKVPPFSTIEARSFIEKELDIPVDQIFVGLTPTTNVVAAASLGQVYKVELKNNNINKNNKNSDHTSLITPNYVAVKVQRPEIIRSISLDMHIIRQLAPIIKKTASIQSDLLGIIDDWGKGFVNELDYVKEAENARLFTEAIVKTPLGKNVFAPRVLTEYSTKKILTTEWVEGERLEKVSKEEVVKLCSLAMNTYLTMMLESPILHADPHPGNLRSTPDGRLCIMDWGLVTSINPDLQLNFIDHISHLVSRDYEEVPGDLVKLGFIPPGKENLATDAGVVTVLADIYGKWALGGGAAKIDVSSVISQFNNLSETYGNLFQLPPYFAYIARAFGVLEGIGLASDPDYAIVSECLPYIAQRLLKYPDERTNAALTGFIFGKEKSNVDTRVIDIERIELLVNGLSNYQTTTTVAATTTTNNLQQSSSNSVVPYESGNILNNKDSTTSSSTNNITVTNNKTIRIQQLEQIIDAVFALLFNYNENSNDVITNNNVASITSKTLKSQENYNLIELRKTTATPPSSSPMQQLVLDEAVKIMGAVSRRQWTVIRNRSGLLPSGRTVLGTIVDPLGFFSGSKLISEDDNDRRIIESTQAIINILQNNPKISVNLSINNLSITEIRLISTILVERIWKRRNDITLLSRNFVGTVMRQMSSRI